MTRRGESVHPDAPPPRGSRSGTRRAGRGDLSPRRVPLTIIEPTEADDAIVIRRLTDDDRAAVTSLAQLDSRLLPGGELLGILWVGLAACVLGALSYDIAYWFEGW